MTIHSFRHRSGARPIVALLALALLAASALVLTTARPAAAADTWTEGSCDGDEGVTVVVDFGYFEGDPAVRCALGAQATGWDALVNAGYALGSVPGFEGQAICTIEALPAEGYPFCWFNGFWSYWHATDAGPWEFSNFGAANRTPPLGSVEGWSFTDLSVWAEPPTVGPWDFPGEVPNGPWSSASALDWLGNELTANGGTMPGFSPGTSDWGLTIDAILALASGGRGDEAPAAIAGQQLDQNLNSYITWDDFGVPGVLGAGQVGKSLLAARILGYDGHAFGGRDLENDLRSLMQTSGEQTGRFSDLNEFGDFSNAFGQSLSILALDRSASGVPDAAIDFLLAQQCPNGGFRLFYDVGAGCASNDNVDTDATAMSVQALQAVEPTPATEAALDAAEVWLLSIQDDETGGFGGTGPTVAVNSNSTGLIVQALRGLAAEAAADAGAHYVTTVQLGADAIGTPAEPDLGAIAYNSDALDGALATGIDPNGRDQWRRATAQAVLALDLPTFGAISEVPPVTNDATASVTPFTPAGNKDMSKFKVDVANAGPTKLALSPSNVTVTVKVDGVLVGDPITASSSATKNLNPAKSTSFGYTWTHGDSLQAGDVVEVEACVSVAGDGRSWNDCGTFASPDQPIDISTSTALAGGLTSKKTVTSFKSTLLNTGSAAVLLRPSNVEYQVFVNDAPAGGTITSKTDLTKRSLVKAGKKANYSFTWSLPGQLSVGDTVRVVSCVHVPGDDAPTNDCSETTFTVTK